MLRTFLLNKTRFKEQLTKQDFGNSTKFWICNNIYVDGDVTVRDHCHIIGKYRDVAHSDCNIKVKFNHKIPAVFLNLKKLWFPSYHARTRQIQFQNKCYTEWTEKIHEL